MEIPAPRSTISEAREQLKFWAEYHKHLTTISAGSIVVIGTFLEKIFPKPHFKITVIVALVGFLATILASVMAMTGLALSNGKSGTKQPINLEIVLFAGGTMLSWLSFTIALIALTIFAIRNLLS